MQVDAVNEELASVEAEEALGGEVREHQRGLASGSRGGLGLREKDQGGGDRGREGHRLIRAVGRAGRPGRATAVGTGRAWRGPAAMRS